MRRFDDFKASSKSGFSVVAAIVAVVVVCILAVVVSNVFSNQKIGEARLNRRVQGEQILVDSAVGLQNYDYDSLYAICVAKGAVGVEVIGTCNVLLGQAPTPSPTPSSTVTPTPSPSSAFLEIRRNWNGDTDTSGNVCIELSRCDTKASNRILEVKLTGYWKDSKSDGLLQSKTLLFRKTRW